MSLNPSKLLWLLIGSLAACTSPHTEPPSPDATGPTQVKWTVTYEPPPPPRDAGVPSGDLVIRDGPRSGLSVSKAADALRLSYRSRYPGYSSVFVELLYDRFDKGRYDLKARYPDIEAFVDHMEAQGELYTWLMVDESVFVYPKDCADCVLNKQATVPRKNWSFCELMTHIEAQATPRKGRAGCMFREYKSSRPISSALQGFIPFPVPEGHDLKHRLAIGYLEPTPVTRIITGFIKALNYRFGATGFLWTKGGAPTWILKLMY